MSPLPLLGRPWGRKHWVLALSAMAVLCTLTALLAVLVVDNIASRHEAVKSLTTARALTVRRIDKLNARIDNLSDHETHSASAAARLAGQVNALRRQILALGGTPVVTEVHVHPSSSPPAPTSSPSPRRTPNPARSPIPPASPPPQPPPTHRPTPAPSPSCIPLLALLCHLPTGAAK